MDDKSTRVTVNSAQDIMQYHIQNTIQLILSGPCVFEVPFVLCILYLSLSQTLVDVMCMLFVSRLVLSFMEGFFKKLWHSVCAKKSLNCFVQYICLCLLLLLLFYLCRLPCRAFSSILCFIT